MLSKTAEEIIQLYDREYANTANFRSLWQQTANLMFPRENQITTEQTPGLDKTLDVYDDTAKMDSQDMASGLSAALIPSGQRFFGLVPSNKNLFELDHIRRYLSNATDITHYELFESNFMLQFNETLRSLIVFGTGNLYSEWDKKRLGLNFKDWDIAMYQFLENSGGMPDTTVLKFQYTARQAKQEFGEDKLSEKIKEALKDVKNENKVFNFIHYVAPREKKILNLKPQISNYFLNMAYESVFVCVEDKAIIEEGGFEENPFTISRWMKSSNEKCGRGQGTEILSTVKTLQQTWRDYIECANKHNNPPREVLDHFEGKVRVAPGACNFVKEKGTIRALEQQMLGNFPITEKVVKSIQDIVHRAFYADVFAPLANLPGDRRTTVEIYQRVKQAMNKLAQPIYRLQSELLSPLITRCVLLLIRNGRIPYPPPELQGQKFGVEYIGELALALRNQQSKAFMQWAAFVGQMEGVFPGVKDNIDEDSAVRRMGRSFGVCEEDIATEEERDLKRRARAQAQQVDVAAQIAGAAAEGYAKTTKKPETGSLAEQVLAEVGA